MSERPPSVTAGLGADPGEGSAGDRGLRRLRPAAVLARLSGRAGSLPFPLAAPSWPGSIPRPAPERGVGVDFETDWSRRYPARLARAMVMDNVARPLTRLLAAPTVKGREVLDHLEGPLIFVANHSSHVDTTLLLSSLPPALRHRTVVAAAADHFFDRRWKGALWAFTLNAIPIERTKVNRRSANEAAALIEDGWSLLVYPEGGRSLDGWGQEFRGGAAYLAKRTGRPVVPVHIHGTRRILRKTTGASHSAGASVWPGSAGRPAYQGGQGRGPRIHRSPTVVTFGAPLAPDPDEDARHFAARLEASVATLANETVTDWWTARRQAASGETPSLQGPDVAEWRRSWALPAAVRPPTPAPRTGSGRRSDGSVRWPASYRSSRSAHRSD